MAEKSSPQGTPPLTPNPDIFPGKTLEACQWFIGEKRFCDKIKKDVSCDGNVNNCPFCK
jgi:hypothetical protein